MNFITSVIILTLLISCGNETLELEAKKKLNSSAAEGPGSGPSSSPSVTINTLSNAGTVNEATYSLSGTCSGDGQVVQVVIGSINLTPSCSSGNWNVASVDISALADGVIAVTADHSDGTNNAPQANGSFSKNSNIPVITINTPTAINIANETSYSLSGICSEDAHTVTLSIGGIAQTPTCQVSKTWSITGLDVSSLSDGPITITADHSDIFSNAAVQASTTVTMDTGAPSVTINALTPINLANESTYSFGGTCSDNTESVSVSVGGIAQSPTCTGGNWTITNLDVSGLTDGSITVTADHSDAVANPATQASSSVQMDTIAPTVTITTPANITNANKANFAVSGTCSENTRQVSVSIGGIAQSPTCTGGNWNVTGLDVTNVVDGMILITADHDDDLANPAAQATVSVSKVSELVTYDFVGISNYTFDTNYVELKAGKATLKTIDLEHQGSEFNSGSHVGSSYSSSKITLKSKMDSDLSVDSILSAKAGSLIAYWKFNESSWNGTLNEVTDSSINGRHGQAFSGANTTSGLIGSNAGNFNSTNFVNLAPITLGTRGTISHWVKTYHDTGTLQSVMYFGNGADGNHNGYGAGAEIHTGISGNNFSFYYNDTHGGPANFSISNTSSLNFGEWYHLVVTWNDLNIIKIYVNGVEESSTTATTRALSGFTPVVTKIGITGNNTRGLDGEIDELSIWNDELTSSDIQSLYNTQKVGFADSNDLNLSWTPQWSSLVGYWKMDGNWQDSSGKGNHGTAAADATVTSSSKVGAGAGSFDGVGDKVSFGSSGTLYDNKSFISIAGWVKGSTSSTVSSEIFTKQNVVLVNTDLSGFIRMWINDGGWKYSNLSTTSVFDDQWHYVAAIYDGIDFKIYIDGKLESSKNEPGLTTSTNTHEVILAGRDNGSTYLWIGMLDEFAAWSSALTDEEVSLIYNRQKQKYAGHYESPIINMGTPTAPTKVEWLTDLPFMKELPKTSESSADYSALVGSNGSTSDDDLMSGIVGIWHFNDTSLNSAPLGRDFIDSSGNDMSAVETGGVKPGQEGLFFKALYFDGVDDYIVTDNLFSSAPDDFTFSYWVKPLSYPSSSSSGLITASNFNNPRMTISTTGTINFGFRYTAGNWAFGASSGSHTLKLNSWSHISGVVTGANSSSPNAKIYLNGELVGEKSDFSGSIYSLTGIAFGKMDATTETNVYLDELGVWSRALHSSEITQLYRRGANRLKLQVRSCDDSTCSNDEEWQGPDNANGEFYFSELNNCSVLTASGTCDFANSGEVNTFLPDFDLSNAGQFTNYVLAQPQKQYFQYRVLMESDDESATPTFPSLTSIDFGTKYFGGSPSVVTNTPQAYTKLYNFSVTKTGSCEPKYQLARNGSYYYFSGGSWIAATDDVAQANTEAEVSANIAQFVTDQGTGNLTVRAYLQSDTDQACSIDGIQITGEN